MSQNPAVESFEMVLEDLLGSWTALDLAVGHYDGPIRDANEKRTILLESLSDAIRLEKYELPDIAEFINEYMFENFSMELDDNSQYDVARICMEAWLVCKDGRIPHIPLRKNGASCSVVKDLAEEVETCSNDDTEMADESNANSRSTQPKMVTDDDGWTTVVPRQL